MAARCILELIGRESPTEHQEVGAYLVAEFLGIMRRAYFKG